MKYNTTIFFVPLSAWLSRKADAGNCYTGRKNKSVGSGVVEGLWSWKYFYIKKLNCLYTYTAYSSYIDHKDKEKYIITRLL